MDCNNKILLNAPYYSQWRDVKDADWQYRSCGIASLKMAMDFFGNADGNLSLDGLIKEGLSLSAYKPNVGWIHDGLVLIAKKHGFENSFRKEWPNVESSVSNKNGVGIIVSILEENIPVLASVKSGTGGHLILLIGFKKEGDALNGFYYHDPDAKKTSEGMNKFIPAKDFLGLWKGRIIVVKK